MKIKTFLFLAFSFFAIGTIQGKDHADSSKINTEQKAPEGVEDTAPESPPKAVTTDTVYVSNNNFTGWINEIKTWINSKDKIGSPNEFNGRVELVNMIIIWFTGFLGFFFPGLKKLKDNETRVAAVSIVFLLGAWIGFDLSLLQVGSLIISSELAKWLYDRYISKVIKSSEVQKIIERLLTRTAQAQDKFVN